MLAYELRERRLPSRVLWRRAAGAQRGCSLLQRGGEHPRGVSPPDVGDIGHLVRRYELVFVDDGSRDSTPQLLNELQQANPAIIVIHLSRNFGHQAAISAGIDFARGDALVIMDGDLQDAPEAITDFVAAWRDGAEVAYAVRTKRKESLFKRAGYFAFYRLLHMVSDIDIPLDSGDFCLMTRKVADALTSFRSATASFADCGRSSALDGWVFLTSGTSGRRENPGPRSAPWSRWQWTGLSASAATRCAWRATAGLGPR